MKSKTELPMMIARGVAVAAKVMAALLLLAVIFVVLVFALEFPSMRNIIAFAITQTRMLCWQQSQIR